MLKVFAALIPITLIAVPAFAGEDDADRAARWSELKHAVFGDRDVGDAGSTVSLDAPNRAMDAALVPITITIDSPGHVKTLYLTVDGNPSPLVGTFHFGPAADPRVIRTRVRIEQYTLIHAVIETQDGKLLATERFVKAAGGCSAPMGKDAALAASRLGQMRLRIDGDAPLAPGGSETAQLLVSHPNNNGMQVDQLTHNYIPPRYIQDIKVTSGDQMVFTLESDISLSEDPAITFEFKPAGPVKVEVEDSTKAVFKQDFDLPHHAT